MTMKLRVSYTKLGKVRFIGHRDVAHIWERALRKAGVPVAMSAGFTPRPRLAFGLALPTGAESLVELIDITIDAGRSPGSFAGFSPEQSSDGTTVMLQELAGRLSEALPTGMDVSDIWNIDGSADRSALSLQESVVASSWVLLVEGPDVPAAIEGVARATSVPLERERKGERHRDDLRPSILEIGLAAPERLAGLGEPWAIPGPWTAIDVVLGTTGRGVRPTELVEVLVPGADPWDHLRRVIRTNQWIEREGRRIDALTDRAACPVGSA